MLTCRPTLQVNENVSLQFTPNNMVLLRTYSKRGFGFKKSRRGSKFAFMQWPGSRGTNFLGTISDRRYPNDKADAGAVADS